jgi:hypothetical protein
MREKEEELCRCRDERAPTSNMIDFFFLFCRFEMTTVCLRMNR